MVTTSSEDPPVRRRRTGRPVALVAGGVVLALLAAAAVVVRLPYDSIAPGSTYAVNDLVLVKGHPTYPPKGRLLYVTVSVRERVSPVEAVAGWVDPEVAVLPERDVRGPVPRNQYERLNVEAMADSKTSAKVVALRHLGFRDLGAGAEVAEVERDLPAAGILRPKDVIVAVDGKPVSTSEDAVAAIRTHKAGDAVGLRVVRDGGPPQELEGHMGTGDRGQPMLGVRLTTKVQLPFEITIDSGDVVGPSAGLAYALELIDLLTPGELTGGVRVAATGDLAPGGQVGPVGGIGQKTVAVRRAGAKLFLVPRENLAEARAHAGAGMRVSPIDNVDDALRALGGLTGSNAMALADPAAGPRAG